MTDPSPITEEQNTSYITAILDMNRLGLAKQRIDDGDESFDPALDALCKEADLWSEAGPFSVMNKTVTPPSGDKHDYMSYGVYWWPDPTKKDGLPYIRRDGEVNPETSGPIADRAALERMTSGVETLTLASFFTDEEEYAARAVDYIKTWFFGPTTRMNPHQKYGQAIPGRCEGRGIGLIETRRFVQVINSAPLLQKMNALTNAQLEELKAWFKAFLLWMRESDNGKNESNEHNNHGTWYDVQVANYALFTGEKEIASAMLESAVKNRLESHVKPDGSQPHELGRTRSLTYSLINLSGLLALAEMGKSVGVDYWSVPTTSESLLRAAIDFLGQFSDAAHPWPYQQITPLDRDAIFPFLRQARVFTGDSRYDTCCEKLPQHITATHRANLLWPIP